MTQEERHEEAVLAQEYEEMRARGVSLAEIGAGRAKGINVAEEAGQNEKLEERQAIKHIEEM